jgi:anti-anti-sigma regulatory factor
MLHQGSDCDVVIDFSSVDVVGGTCLAGLLKIQRLVNECGHRLTLCNVVPATKGVFTIVHLDDVFEFAEDRFTALACPQKAGRSEEFRPVRTQIVPANVLTVTVGARS